MHPASFIVKTRKFSENLRKRGRTPLVGIVRKFGEKNEKRTDF